MRVCFTHWSSQIQATRCNNTIEHKEEPTQEQHVIPQALERSKQKRYKQRANNTMHIYNNTQQEQRMKREREAGSNHKRM